MSKGKKNEPFDPRNMKPEEILKFEIATELGLGDKVIESGWRSLSAKERVKKYKITIRVSFDARRARAERGNSGIFLHRKGKYFIMDFKEEIPCR